MWLSALSGTTPYVWALAAPAAPKSLPGAEAPRGGGRGSPGSGLGQLSHAFFLFNKCTIFIIILETFFLPEIADQKKFHLKYAQETTQNLKKKTASRMVSYPAKLPQ
ncbi:hypothetical protein AAY473_031272, partial [Plecturocebus cupreus]